MVLVPFVFFLVFFSWVFHFPSGFHILRRPFVFFATLDFFVTFEFFVTFVLRGRTQ
jgi:hypothetical protein